MTVQEIYDIIDGFAPFSTQESYDNAGLLCGNPAAEVHRVLLTLDITVPVVREAAELGADLILAHHPVIWNPLKRIPHTHPVTLLIQNGIAAICAHTNLDLADGGLNDCIGDVLTDELGLSAHRHTLAELPGGRSLGCIASLPDEWDLITLAVKLREILDCRDLRYYAGAKADEIQRIAWCTGSGGDLMPEAIAGGADVLITGDCKHSVWAEAQNLDFSLIDCGHFETEVPVVYLFRRLLQQQAPEIETVISEAGTQPFFRTLN